MSTSSSSNFEQDDNYEFETNSNDSDDNDNTEGNISNNTIIDTLLYEKSKISVSHSVLTIMDLYIHNKLTKATLKATLKALQLLLPKPNNMPKTVFQLFQFVRNLTCTCTVIKHYYCRRCLFYNGTDSFSATCTSCSSIEGTSHFYEFDIRDQIRHMFEVRNLADKLRVAPYDNNLISDITDGTEYIRVN